MIRCVDKKRGKQFRDPQHIQVYPAKTVGTKKCVRCGRWIKE